MKNRLAAFSRRIIPYNPEFRRLPLVKSVNSALLLQQLDFWFDKYNSFWKFIEPAPKHPRYTEGDSWTEELAMSKEEFRTAFAAIGIPYKSKNQFRDAENKFIQKDSEGNEVEYYYASYFDRQHGLTYYIRNDELLDRELAELIQASSLKDRIRPERPTPETIDENPAPVATPAPIVDPVASVVANPSRAVPKSLSLTEKNVDDAGVEPPKSTKAPKRTAEEIAAEKAAKAEERRLAAEARAEAKRLKQEKLEQENQVRYEFFGSKERYMKFNAWFWGVHMKDSKLDNPAMFYSIMMNNLLAGGEKYRHIVLMFDQAELKATQEAKVAQEQQRMQALVTDNTEPEDEDLEMMLSQVELEALRAAGLDSDAYSQLLRRLVGQPSHEFRMTCIEREAERQIVRNQRRARLEAQE